MAFISFSDQALPISSSLKWAPAFTSSDTTNRSSSSSDAIDFPQFHGAETAIRHHHPHFDPSQTTVSEQSLVDLNCPNSSFQTTNHHHQQQQQKEFIYSTENQPNSSPSLEESLHSPNQRYSFFYRLPAMSHPGVVAAPTTFVNDPTVRNYYYGTGSAGVYPNDHHAYYTGLDFGQDDSKMGAQDTGAGAAFFSNGNDSGGFSTPSPPGHRFFHPQFVSQHQHHYHHPSVDFVSPDQRGWQQQQQYHSSPSCVAPAYPSPTYTSPRTHPISETRPVASGVVGASSTNSPSVNGPSHTTPSIATSMPRFHSSPAMASTSQQHLAHTPTHHPRATNNNQVMHSVVSATGAASVTTTLRVVHYYPMRGPEGTQITIHLDKTPLIRAGLFERVNTAFYIYFEGSDSTIVSMGKVVGSPPYPASTTSGAGTEDSDPIVIAVTVPLLQWYEAGLYLRLIDGNNGVVLGETYFGTFTFMKREDSRSSQKRAGDHLESNRSVPPTPEYTPNGYFDPRAFGQSVMQTPGLSPAYHIRPYSSQTWSTADIGAYTRPTSSRPLPEVSTPSSPSQGSPDVKKTVKAERSSSPVGETVTSSTLRHPPKEPKDYSQPNLVRTTQLSVGPDGFGTSADKAILNLRGDLNQMALGWTTEEWNSGRRLVQFWCKQKKNVINCTFRPLPLASYTLDAIVVSCIYRAHDEKCYITSVDAIYLLEAMISTRFTVEEKNRIRRNLEGFKPLTVSKVRSDSEPFFRLIMGFGAPKPRNIEKDVKVFPWAILTTAFAKIVGKYSASYKSCDRSEPTVGENDSDISDPFGSPLDFKPNVKLEDEEDTLEPSNFAHPSHSSHSLAYPPGYGRPGSFDLAAMFGHHGAGNIGMISSHGSFPHPNTVAQYTERANFIDEISTPPHDDFGPAADNPYLRSPGERTPSPRGSPGPKSPTASPGQPE